MFSAISSTALSGMQASQRRLANSADNIANIHSTQSRVNGQTVQEPFKPQEIQQTSLEQGGVRSVARQKDPATVAVYDPDNSAANADGLVDYPNVNLEQELVEQKVATYDYKANLKVLEAKDDMMEETLDILA